MNRIEDKIQINEWSKLKYCDPHGILVQFRSIEKHPSLSTLPERDRTLRTKKLQTYLEMRQAALFCYGIGKALETTIYYSLYENADYDCIARWKENGFEKYAPIQLKEIVPEGLNKTTSLNNELKKLQKYVTSKNLIVAMHLNRKGSLKFSEITFPKLEIAEVWLYGGLSEDQEKWFIYGNLLDEPQFFEFKYPDE